MMIRLKIKKITLLYNKVNNKKRVNNTGIKSIFIDEYEPLYIEKYISIIHITIGIIFNV